MRQLTPEQKAATDARRKAMQDLVRRVGKMTDAERRALADKMPALVTCEGHALSFHNTVLLACQCPTATIVGGFRQWKKHRRAVRKGEHGYGIWIPKVPAEREEAQQGENADSDPALATSEGLRFFVGTVFDISQTEEVQTAVAAG